MEASNSTWVNWGRFPRGGYIWTKVWRMRMKQERGLLCFRMRVIWAKNDLAREDCENFPFQGGTCRIWLTLPAMLLPKYCSLSTSSPRRWQKQAIPVLKVPSPGRPTSVAPFGRDAHGILLFAVFIWFSLASSILFPFPWLSFLPSSSSLILLNNLVLHPFVTYEKFILLFSFSQYSSSLHDG